MYINKIFQYIYLVWAVFWFLLGFILVYPFIYIALQNKKWHYLYFYFSKAWAIIYYGMSFQPVKRIWGFKPQKNQVYIYCPNHFSYLDIALLTLAMPSYFVFVGLHDLEKIPLFGYMYRKIHITIDRSSRRSRYQTYQNIKTALNEGKNVVIFPEGGIWTEDFPRISPFKEGAFRIAIELGVPIIPVTIPFNWKIMPVVDLKNFKYHKSHVIFHKAIETKSLSRKDINSLKDKTYEAIDTQMKEYFN